MKKGLIERDRLGRYLQCYGEFNIEDPVCRTLCALRLRCAVDCEQREQMDLMEDLFISDDIRVKAH
jgi:hypothetical protein